MSHAFSQKSFAESLGLNFPLLSDYPHGRTVLEYDVANFEGEAGRLYARQSFFLVDKQGILRGIWSQRPSNPDEVWAPDTLFSSAPILEVARKIAGER